MNTYFIHESNLERLQKKIERIRNKCIKYGCDFHYAEIGEEFRTTTDADGYQHTDKYIEVEAEGTAKVNGWIFVGTLEHMNEGTIVRNFREELKVPDRYYNCEPTCEHCKIQRNRKNSYIVYNEETKEFKQVGSSCLCDFTGGLSAEAIASYISCFDELIQCEYAGPGVDRTEWKETSLILAYAIDAVNHFGYESSSYERAEYTTRSRVSCFYDYDNRPSRLWKPDKEMVEDFRAKFGDHHDSEEIKNEVAAIIDYFKNIEADNDYLHNLQVIANTEYIKSSQTGYLVSMVPTYRKAMNRKVAEEKKAAQNKKDAETSNYLGEAGDKITVNVAEAIVITSWDNQYGTTYRIRFTDENGNVVMWDSSTGIYADKKVESVKGTIKKLDEYNGVKQTWLTRCRVTYAPEVENASHPEGTFDMSVLDGLFE